MSAVSQDGWGTPPAGWGSWDGDAYQCHLGHGWPGGAGEVGAVMQQQRQAEAGPEEEQAWLKDPDGHFHLRQSAN